MAALRELVEYGWGVLFGLDGLTAPATFNPPAGQNVQSVSVGEGRSQKWQHDAWRLWKWVGELHYPTTRLSRQTSQLDWRVRVNGRELTPEAAKREVQAVTAGIGPVGATYLLALNDQVAGDVWYVEEDSGRFSVWSVMEKDLDKRIAAAREAGRIVRRMHQPDPTDPQQADSSVRTAIGPAEELMTLEALSQAQSRSRLSQAGVIITPAEQLYAAEDPWEKNLVESMSAAIKDVKSASALAPIHIRMRRDLIEFVRYVTFPRPYDDLIDRKQERAVTRVASALDIEPELIQGIGDSTYWNAWAVSMDTYQAHIAPRADRIGDLFGTVSEELRKRAGQNNPVVEFEPDPRIMLARRSSVRDAFDGLKLGVVGFRYAREAMGATEGDAPTEEEMDLILQFQGQGETMDRERRVGENPGPARSSPENASEIITDYDVAVHARKAVGFKLKEAWRNTPKRNYLHGVDATEWGCYIPRSDIEAEFDLDGGIRAIITEAVAEVASPDEAERLVSWILDTLERPTQSLREREMANV